MKAMSLLFVSVVCVLFARSSVCAHHATATQFDITRMIQLKGVISKLEWANPHVHVVVDVKRDSTHEDHWDVELASPGGVVVSGLTKDLFKPGTPVTVKGYPAKVIDESHHAACATQLTMPNGITATFVVGV